MISAFFPQHFVARDADMRRSRHGAGAPQQLDKTTAHGRAADELLARMGSAQAFVASGQQRRRARPTTVHLQGGSHGVLLFHGLSSTPAELNYLAKGLNRAGYTVKIPVIEGYSHGLGARETSGHRKWMSAALAAFDTMRSSCATVSVGGLCIGSLLALSVAGARPSLTSAKLGLSTTMYYDGWANPWTRHLLPVVRYLPLAGRMRIKERAPFGVKDERIRALVAAQMRASGASDAGASQLRVRDLLEAQSLAQVVRHSLHTIKAPTLLIHAKDDESASPRSSYEVAKGVGAKHVKLVLLSNSYHMISIDQERAHVLTELKSFLGHQLGHQAINALDAPKHRAHRAGGNALWQAQHDGCIA